MSEPNYWSRGTTRRVSRRRVLGTAVSGAAGLTAIGLAGCGKPASSPSPSGSASQSPATQAAQGSPKQGGTLNVLTASNIPLDPQKASSGALQGVSGVMSRVFRFKTGADPKVTTNHDIEPDLGLSAESPDAITWTLKLQTNAKFHNVAPVSGHAVEAEDVKATFTRFLDPATSAPNRGAVSMIDASQIQTPDKNTVVFKLSYPYAPFRKLLASPAYGWVYPREAASGGYDPAKVVIGSGPFTMESAQPDVAYTYKKNPAYFEAGMPYVDTVRLAVITDPAQQMAQFSAGNLDEYLPPIDSLKAAQQRNPKATTIKADYGTSNPIYFQLGDQSSPFQDVRVRRAVSMAIDRDSIAKAIFGGEFEQVVFVPAYMGKWALTVGDLDAQTSQYYKYNPAEAKKLLEAAGAPNLQVRFFRITGQSNFDSPTYVKSSEAIASMLNAVGFKTSIVTQDYTKDFVDSGKGVRQGYFDKDVLLYGGAASYTEADDWLFSYFHSKSTSNQEKLNDPTLDAMIDKERTITNEDDRLKAVQDIERYIADKMYAISTLGPYYWIMRQPRVQNYQYSSTSDKIGESYAKIWLNA